LLDSSDLKCGRLRSGGSYSSSGLGLPTDIDVAEAR